MSSRTRRLSIEVLVTGAHRDGQASRIEESGTGAELLDLADHRESGARGFSKVVAESGHLPRVAGQQKLEVFAAGRRPAERIRVEGRRDLARRRVNGQAVERDAGADAAFAAEVAEIGGEPVRAVHHRVHALGGAEPA